MERMADLMTNLAAMAAAAASTAYAAVALVLSRRRVSTSARRAHHAFIVWWGGLSVLGFFLLARDRMLADWLASRGLPAMLGATYLVLVILFLSLACLLLYLLYIHTARPALMVLPFAYYAVVAAWTLWLVHGFGGACIVPAEGCVPPAGWSAGDPAALGTGEPRPAWGEGLFGLALVVPPLVAALLYLTLFARVPDRTARYRIVLVAVGILAWFGFSAAEFAGTMVDPEAGRHTVVSSLLGLCSALLVLAAYLPPKAVQAWLGVESLPSQVRRERSERNRGFAPFAA